MTTRITYRPPPAAGLNQAQFEDYSPPPYYDQHSYYPGHNFVDPPPYFTHSITSEAPGLETLEESPEDSAFASAIPGSRRPLPQEDEEVFFPATYVPHPYSMGSSSSMMPQYKFTGRSASEVNSGKTGMKQKLKNSIDKLKPFAWGSTDKLDTSLTRRFKKNSNKPNTRRYSDSIAPCSIDSTHTVLTKRPESTSSYNDVLIRKINLTDTPAIPPRKPVKRPGNFMKSYFGANKNCAQVAKHKSSPQEEYLTINITDESYIVNSSASKLQSNGQRDTEQNTYVEMPSYSGMDLNSYYYNALRQGTDYKQEPVTNKHAAYNHHDQLKPKGTWNLLKMSAKQPTPPKPLQYFRQTTEIDDRPPPRITPISGQLLQSDNFKGGIIRPTAYKPSSNQLSYSNCGTMWPEEDTKRDRDSIQSSDSSNCEHTGRLSASSEAKGNSYSASEGYESARISSSTVAEHNSDQDASFQSGVGKEGNSLDDVMLSDLENRVQDREHEISELRQALGMNEKAIRKVSTDSTHYNKQNNSEINDGIKSQARSTVSMQSELQSRCQLLLEEKRRLQELNSELEDQISSVISDTSSVMHESSNTTNILEEKLEEIKWELQQKCGEISLLKGQIREFNSESERKNIELASQRLQNRKLKSERENQEAEIKALKEKLTKCEKINKETDDKLSRAENEISELKLQKQNTALINGKDRLTEDQNHNSVYNEKDNNKIVNLNLLLQSEIETLHKKVNDISKSKEDSENAFSKEKQNWNDEKHKVLRYQQKLQSSYINMKNKSELLEDKVNELMSKLKQVERRSSASSSGQELSFPTEI